MGTEEAVHEAPEDELDDGLDDALRATRTGRWRWDSTAGGYTLDAVAAELLGLPPRPATVPEAVVRGRFHAEDYIAGQRSLAFSAAEGGLAETQMRVVDAQGTVLRTVRLRVQAIADGQRSGQPSHMLGLMCELPSRDHAPPPESTTWRRAHEAFLLDTSRALSEAETTRDVLRVVGGLAMPDFQPAAISVYGREGNEIRVTEYVESVPSNYSPEQRRAVATLPLDAPFPAAQVARTGRAVYLHSPEEYAERFPEAWPSITPFGRQSWAYLPLVVAGRTLGVWMTAFTEPAAFTFEERVLLTGIARLLAQALARTFLHDTERQLTADLQHTMRPAPTPEVPGMDITARYVPTGAGLKVGGDWYDVIPLPSGRFALVIGDVQGHDVRAAATMAQLRIALRAYASEGHRPDAVLARASRFLATLPAEGIEASGHPADEDDDATERFSSDQRFATCLYIEADPPSGTLDIARAGHLDPAMIMPDGSLLTRPTAGGLPLGLDPDGDYPTTRLVLQPGETLLLCTDGLLETGRRDLDEGWARLREAMAGQAGEPVTELADTLIDTVRSGDAAPATGDEEDDIALLLLRRPATQRLDATTPARRVVLTIAQTESARVAEARGQLEALLHDWADEERVFGATLLLSEALTNVLTHTDGDAVLVAELSGPPGDRRLRVEVADASDELPHLRDPGELASTGRGLVLMDSYADDWGVAPRGSGKAIWFELAEIPPVTPAGP